MVYFTLGIALVEELIGFQINQIYLLPRISNHRFGKSEVIVNGNMLETISIQKMAVYVHSAPPSERGPGFWIF